MFRNSKALKFIAGMTVLIFTVSDLAFAAPSVMQSAPAFSAQKSNVEWADPLFSGEVQLNLPENLGRVETSFAGKPNTPRIFHIQTAHGHFEAQKNIQEILGYLSQHQNVNTLLLEGASEALQPEVLNFFPKDSEKNVRITEAFARHSLVKGPELFLMKNPTKRALGVEEIQDYRKNRQSFKDVLLQKQKSQSFLDDFEEGIQRLESIYLNNELRRFLKRWEDFELNDSLFSSKLRFLKSEAKELQQVDLEDISFQYDFPQLVRYFKIQKFSNDFDPSAYKLEKEKFLSRLRKYADVREKQFVERITHVLNGSLDQAFAKGEAVGLFERMLKILPRDFDYQEFPHLDRFIGTLILKSELDALILHREVAKLGGDIAERLTESDKERSVLKLHRQFVLLKKLFDLQLTPEQFEEVTASALKPSQIAKQFKELNGDLRVKEVVFQGLAELDALFSRAVQFYQDAKNRDASMLLNIEKQLEKGSLGNVAVVTGGFHSEPFKEYFESHDYSYALISPTISDVDEKGYQLYVEKLLGEATKENSKCSVETSMDCSQLEDVFMMVRGQAAHGVSPRHLISMAEKALTAMRLGGRLELTSDDVGTVISHLQDFYGLDDDSRSEKRLQKKSKDGKIVWYQGQGKLAREPIRTEKLYAWTDLSEELQSQIHNPAFEGLGFFESYAGGVWNETLLNWSPFERKETVRTVKLGARERRSVVEIILNSFPQDESFRLDTIDYTVQLSEKKPPVTRKLLVVLPAGKNPLATSAGLQHVASPDHWTDGDAIAEKIYKIGAADDFFAFEAVKGRELLVKEVIKEKTPDINFFKLYLSMLKSHRGMTDEDQRIFLLGLTTILRMVSGENAELSALIPDFAELYNELYLDLAPENLKEAAIQYQSYVEWMRVQMLSRAISGEGIAEADLSLNLQDYLVRRDLDLGFERYISESTLEIKSFAGLGMFLKHRLEPLSNWVKSYARKEYKGADTEKAYFWETFTGSANSKSPVFGFYNQTLASWIAGSEGKDSHRSYAEEYDAVQKMLLEFQEEHPNFNIQGFMVRRERVVGVQSKTKSYRYKLIPVKNMRSTTLEPEIFDEGAVKDAVQKLNAQFEDSHFVSVGVTFFLDGHDPIFLHAEERLYEFLFESKAKDHLPEDVFYVGSDGVYVNNRERSLGGAWILSKLEAAYREHYLGAFESGWEPVGTAERERPLVHAMEETQKPASSVETLILSWVLAFIALGVAGLLYFVLRPSDSAFSTKAKDKEDAEQKAGLKPEGESKKDQKKPLKYVVRKKTFKPFVKSQYFGKQISSGNAKGQVYVPLENGLLKSRPAYVVNIPPHSKNSFPQGAVVAFHESVIGKRVKLAVLDSKGNDVVFEVRGGYRPEDAGDSGNLPALARHEDGSFWVTRDGFFTLFFHEENTNRVPVKIAAYSDQLKSTPFSATVLYEPVATVSTSESISDDSGEDQSREERRILQHFRSKISWLETGKLLQKPYEVDEVFSFEALQQRLFELVKAQQELGSEELTYEGVGVYDTSGNLRWNSTIDFKGRQSDRRQIGRKPHVRLVEALLEDVAARKLEGPFQLNVLQHADESGVVRKLLVISSSLSEEEKENAAVQNLEGLSPHSEVLVRVLELAGHPISDSTEVPSYEAVLNQFRDLDLDAGFFERLAEELQNNEQMTVKTKQILFLGAAILLRALAERQNIFFENQKLVQDEVAAKEAELELQRENARIASLETLLGVSQRQLTRDGQSIVARKQENASQTVALESDLKVLLEKISDLERDQTEWAEKRIQEEEKWALDHGILKAEFERHQMSFQAWYQSKGEIETASEKEISEIESQVRQLSDELTGLQAKETNLNDANAAWQKTQKEASLRTRIEAHKKDLAQKRRELEEKQAAWSRDEEAWRAQEQVLKDRETSLNGIRDRWADYERRLNESKSVLESQKGELNQRHARLVAESEALGREQVKLDQRVQTHQGRRTQITAREREGWEGRKKASNEYDAVLQGRREKVERNLQEWSAGSLIDFRPQLQLLSGVVDNLFAREFKTDAGKALKLQTALEWARLNYLTGAMKVSVDVDPQSSLQELAQRASASKQSDSWLLGSFEDFGAFLSKVIQPLSEEVGKDNVASLTSFTNRVRHLPIQEYLNRNALLHQSGPLLNSEVVSDHPGYEKLIEGLKQIQDPNVRGFLVRRQPEFRTRADEEAGRFYWNYQVLVVKKKKVDVAENESHPPLEVQELLLELSAEGFTNFTLRQPVIYLEGHQSHPAVYSELYRVLFAGDQVSSLHFLPDTLSFVGRTGVEYFAGQNRDVRESGMATRLQEVYRRDYLQGVQSQRPLEDLGIPYEDLSESVAQRTSQPVTQSRSAWKVFALSIASLLLLGLGFYLISRSQNSEKIERTDGQYPSAPEKVESVRAELRKGIDQRILRVLQERIKALHYESGVQQGVLVHTRSGSILPVLLKPHEDADLAVFENALQDAMRNFETFRNIVPQYLNLDDFVPSENIRKFFDRGVFSKIGKMSEEKFWEDVVLITPEDWTVFQDFRNPVQDTSSAEGLRKIQSLKAWWEKLEALPRQLNSRVQPKTAASQVSPSSDREPWLLSGFVRVAFVGLLVLTGALFFLPETKKPQVSDKQGEVRSSPYESEDLGQRFSDKTLEELPEDFIWPELFDEENLPGWLFDPSRQSSEDVVTVEGIDIPVRKALPYQEEEEAPHFDRKPLFPQFYDTLSFADYKVDEIPQFGVNGQMLLDGQGDGKTERSAYYELPDFELGREPLGAIVSFSTNVFGQKIKFQVLDQNLKPLSFWLAQGVLASDTDEKGNLTPLVADADGYFTIPKDSGFVTLYFPQGVSPKLVSAFSASGEEMGFSLHLRILKPEYRSELREASNDELEEAARYHQFEGDVEPIRDPFLLSEKDHVKLLSDYSAEELAEFEALAYELLFDGGLYSLISAAGESSRMNTNLAPDDVKAIVNHQQILSKFGVPIGQREWDAEGSWGAHTETVTYGSAFFQGHHQLFRELGKIARELGVSHRLGSNSVGYVSNELYHDEHETIIRDWNANFGLNPEQVRRFDAPLGYLYAARPSDVKRFGNKKALEDEAAFRAALEFAEERKRLFGNGGDASHLVLTDRRKAVKGGHASVLHGLVASGELLHIIDTGKKVISFKNIDNFAAKYDRTFLQIVGLFMKRGLHFQGEVSHRAPGFEGGSLIVDQRTGRLRLAEDFQINASLDQRVENGRERKGSYWFNNAVALFTPEFVANIYQAENQSYEEFVEEYREALRKAQFGNDDTNLRAIVNRGKAKFTTLYSPKLSKSEPYVVTMNPEQNFWQSMSLVSHDMEVGAVGVHGPIDNAGGFSEIDPKYDLPLFRFGPTKIWKATEAEMHAQEEKLKELGYPPLSLHLRQILMGSHEGNHHFNEALMEYTRSAHLSAEAKKHYQEHLMNSKPRSELRQRKSSELFQALQFMVALEAIPQKLWVEREKVKVRTFLKKAMKKVDRENYKLAARRVGEAIHVLTNLEGYQEHVEVLKEIKTRLEYFDEQAPKEFLNWIQNHKAIEGYSLWPHNKSMIVVKIDLNEAKGGKGQPYVPAKILEYFELDPEAWPFGAVSVKTSVGKPGLGSLVFESKNLYRYLKGLPSERRQEKRTVLEKVQSFVEEYPWEVLLVGASAVFFVSLALMLVVWRKGLKSSRAIGDGAQLGVEDYLMGHVAGLFYQGHEPRLADVLTEDHPMSLIDIPEGLYFYLNGILKQDKKIEDYALKLSLDAPASKVKGPRFKRSHKDKVAYPLVIQDAPEGILQFAIEVFVDKDTELTGADNPDYYLFHFVDLLLTKAYEKNKALHRVKLDAREGVTDPELWMSHRPRALKVASWLHSFVEGGLISEEEALSISGKLFYRVSGKPSRRELRLKESVGGSQRFLKFFAWGLMALFLPFDASNADIPRDAKDLEELETLDGAIAARLGSADFEAQLLDDFGKDEDRQEEWLLALIRAQVRQGNFKAGLLMKKIFTRYPEVLERFEILLSSHLETLENDLREHEDFHFYVTNLLELYLNFGEKLSDEAMDVLRVYFLVGTPEQKAIAHEVMKQGPVTEASILFYVNVLTGLEAAEDVQYAKDALADFSRRLNGFYYEDVVRRVKERRDGFAEDADAERKVFTDLLELIHPESEKADARKRSEVREAAKVDPAKVLKEERLKLIGFFTDLGFIQRSDERGALSFQRDSVWGEALEVLTLSEVERRFDEAGLNERFELILPGIEKIKRSAYVEDQDVFQVVERTAKKGWIASLFKKESKRSELRKVLTDSSSSVPASERAQVARARFGNVRATMGRITEDFPATQLGRGDLPESVPAIRWTPSVEFTKETELLVQFFTEGVLPLIKTEGWSREQYLEVLNRIGFTVQIFGGRKNLAARFEAELAKLPVTQEARKVLGDITQLFLSPEEPVHVVMPTGEDFFVDDFLGMVIGLTHPQDKISFIIPGDQIKADAYLKAFNARLKDLGFEHVYTGKAGFIPAGSAESLMKAAFKRIDQVRLKGRVGVVAEEGDFHDFHRSGVAKLSRGRLSKEAAAFGALALLRQEDDFNFEVLSIEKWLQGKGYSAESIASAIAQLQAVFHKFAASA